MVQAERLKGKVPPRFRQGSHQRSTNVPPGSTRVPRGFHEVLQGLRGGASTKKSTVCCMLLGISPELIFLAN